MKKTGPEERRHKEKEKISLTLFHEWVFSLTQRKTFLLKLSSFSMLLLASRFSYAALLIQSHNRDFVFDFSFCLHFGIGEKVSVKWEQTANVRYHSLEWRNS